VTAADKLYWTTQPLGLTGIGLVLDHLIALMSAVLLVWLSGLAGLRLLGYLRLPLNQPLEELIFAIALGMGAGAITILLVGSVLGLSVPGFILSLSVLGALGWRELGRCAAMARATWVLLSRPKALNPLSVFFVVMVALTALFLFAFAFAPPAGYDSLTYHLEVPKLWLEHGRLYLPPDNLHVALVGLTQVLYLPLLAMGSPSSPAVLTAITTLLLICTVFACSRRLFDREVAQLSAAVLCASTIILLVGFTPKVDIALAFFLLSAHYALLLGISQSAPRFTILAAVLLGFGAGVKYMALAYALALLPLFWQAASKEATRREAWRTLALGVAAGALVVLPWLLKNLILVGYPLYPFLAPRLMSPWLAALYGQASPPANTDPRIFSLLEDVREPFSLLKYLTAPSALTPESEGSNYYPNLLLFGLPIWLVLPPLGPRLRLALPALGFAAILLLVSYKTNLRYLIPMLPALTIVACSGVVQLTNRISRRALREGVLVFLGLLTLGPSLLVAGERVSNYQLGRLLVGNVSPLEYLRTSRDPEILDYAQMTTAVNQAVGPHSLILLLFDERAFLFRSPVLRDDALTNWPLLVPLLPKVGCLERTGITHVLINKGAIQYFARRGLPTGSLRLDRFDSFARACLTTIIDRPTFTLYSIRARASH
jgi:4-amino-4-deoxy-L-arabinose transferase-like glycosyltransferase